MRDYTVIDLFSGCGGSAWGFREAGFAIGAAVEINPAAALTFGKNFPESIVYNEDIRNVSGKEVLQKLETTNDKIVVLACPPCQGFSSARRKNQQTGDPRNSLIFEFVRFVEEIRPVAFVMENVPGLAKGIGKDLFDKAITRLSNLGYNISGPSILRTVDFGVPQKRRRLVIMGTRTGAPAAIPEPTHRNPTDTDSKLPVWRTVSDAIRGLPPIKAGNTNVKDPLHVSANLSETNLKRLSVTPKDGGSRTSWPDDLILDCHRNGGYEDVYGRMKWKEPSPTITGGCMMISKGRFGHPTQNRAISLREAALLQTFPKEFVFLGSNQSIALQIGNAVPPLLAFNIGISLLKTLPVHTDSKSRTEWVGGFSSFATR